MGMMENNMETTIEYRGYMGIMENRMETTGLLGLYRGYRVYIGAQAHSSMVCTDLRDVLK